MTRPEWNANIHYDALLADAVPRDASRVLDVGTGDGFLAARLAHRGVGEVIALDADAPVLDRARARWGDLPVTWIHGDLMTHPFPPDSFDAVVSNATLHHLPDPRVALLRCAHLLRPGGVLAVVGFARNGPLDWPWALVGQAALIVAEARHHKWEHTAPQCWPPAFRYAQIRAVAAKALPGSRFRRVLYGRFALTWTRPPA